MSRDEIRRAHPRLDEVSPEVGALDAGALAGALDDDLDEGVALLADLTRATDPRLRARAKQLAASLVIPAARRAGPARPGGSARLGPVRDGGVDLDVEATVERLGEHPRLRVEDLRWRGWRRPGRAVALLVDASGSVTGPPLATAVITAAALVARTGAADQLAVVAFWSKAVVLRPLRDAAPLSVAVDRLLALRGGDTTDLDGGLRAALAQMAEAGVARRDVIVLSDGMANEGGDPLPTAAAASAAGMTVHVLALAPEPASLAACRALASAGGGRMAELRRPSAAPGAVASILGG